MKRNNKKLVWVLMSLIVMSLWLAACGSNKTNEAVNERANTAPAATEAAPNRILTDALGNEVTLPANPKRIRIQAHPAGCMQVRLPTRKLSMMYWKAL